MAKSELFVRHQSGGVFTVVNESVTTGNIYFVDSGSSTGADSTGYGHNPDAPFLTINYAVAQCTANNGDVVYVMPGHTESVIAAAGLDLNTAGVTIIGLGEGADRPTVTFSTDVTADMNIDGASITIKNILFVNGIDGLDAPIDVNSADFSMINCETRDNNASYQCDDFIVADANADRMTIRNWVHNATGGKAGAQSALNVAANEDMIVDNFTIHGAFAVGAIENGTAWDNAIISNGYIDNTNAGPIPGITLQATSAGGVYNVRIRIATAGSYVSAANDMHFSQCWGMTTDASADVPIGTALTGSYADYLSVIDGYHDVPTADTTTNAVVRDVVGNKTDAASVVASGKSLMAYTKQLVNEIVGSGMNADHRNFGSISVSLSSATWNTAAAHEILTVTGLVRVRIVPVIDTNLAGAANTLFRLGVEGDTDAFIGNTTATELDTGEIWQSSTAANNLPWIDYEAMIDAVVEDDDIGYTIVNAAASGGVLKFYYWWESLDATGAVVAGAGGAL